jgi:hypothetical protein
MTIYTFPLSTFVDKQFNPTRLMGEIKVAIPTLTSVFLKRNQDDGKNLDVTVNRVLTAPEQTTLLNTLKAHESDARHLPTVKTRKFAAIDRKTGVIIDRGFQFMGKTHSLSDNAQKNLLGMDALREDPLMQYPIKFNSKDDSGDSVLTDAAEVHMMFLTAVGTMRAAWDSGTALKDQVRAATTVEQVNAVTDAR